MAELPVMRVAPALVAATSRLPMSAAQTEVREDGRQAGLRDFTVDAAYASSTAAHACAYRLTTQPAARTLRTSASSAAPSLASSAASNSRFCLSRPTVSTAVTFPALR